MKTCPSCHVTVFDDTGICYSCLHRFGNARVNHMRERLKEHIGHKIACVAYGDIEDPADVCLECEDCQCVLVSAEDFEREE